MMRLFGEKERLGGSWFAWDERLRFVITGIGNMGLRYAFFALMLQLFSSRHYQLLLALTWGVSTLWAFYIYKYLVFQSDGNHFKEYLRSVAVWFLSYVINAGMLQFMVEYGQMNVYLAQGIAITVIVVINYLLFKHFAFRQEPRPLSWWERLLRFFDVFRK